MVVGEPLDVVVERVDAGRRDDPGLPHRSAELVLETPRPLHQLVRARDERAGSARGAPGRTGPTDRRRGPAPPGGGVFLPRAGPAPGPGGLRADPPPNHPL